MIWDSFVELGMGLEKMTWDVKLGIVLRLKKTEWHVVVAVASVVDD
jgi:hypothetical protein